MSTIKKIFLLGLLVICFFAAQPSAQAESPAGENVTFTFNLQKGTNLISLPVLASYTAESFTSIHGSNVKYITEYNISSEAQKTYVLGFSEGENNFEIKPDYGYFIYVTESCSFTVTGQKAGARNVPLYKGYNIVGWTSMDKSTAADAFAAPLGSNLINVSKCFSNGSFQTYTPGVSGKADDFAVEPGQGYVLFAGEDCTLTYSGAQGPAAETLQKEPDRSVPGFEAAMVIAILTALIIRRKPN